MGLIGEAVCGVVPIAAGVPVLLAGGKVEGSLLLYTNGRSISRQVSICVNCFAFYHEARTGVRYESQHALTPLCFAL